MESELAGLAPLAGSAFTGNVSVGGSLNKGGYEVLTTQYTPPVTDLSTVTHPNLTFTGTVSAGTIAASSLSYVDTTTQVATDVMT